MKLSILPCSLFPELIGDQMSIAEWLTMAKGFGFDGADISMSFVKAHSAKAMRELRESLDAVDIERVMICTYPDFTNPDPKQRERELAYFCTDIATCAQLGFKYVRTLAGQNHPGVKMEDMIVWATECIREAAKFADSQGITLCFEDHAKPGAWDYIDVTFDPQVFLKILDGLRDTSVRVNFDLGNITAFGLNPIDIMDKCLDKIETIHVSDMVALGTLQPVLLGTGACPIRESIHWLAEKGWDKWLCIEECSNKGPEGIRLAGEYVRGIMEELHG